MTKDFQITCSQIILHHTQTLLTVCYIIGTRGLEQLNL